MDLIIDIYSDLVCPWCFIGKRRLEKALLMREGQYEAKVTWRAFQLNPGMAKEGMDRTEYRVKKFGSLGSSRALDVEVQAAGAEEGIPFAFDRIERTPNTMEAHRLIWVAGTLGLQDEIVEALFESYFLRGDDIGDRRVLRDLAEKAGVMSRGGEPFLEDRESLEAVEEEMEISGRMGIRAVPCFIINSAFMVTGARRSEELASLLDQMMGKEGVRE